MPPGFANESPTVLDITANTLSVNYDGSGNFTVASQFPLAYPNATVFLNNDSNSSYDISGSPGLTISLKIDSATGAINGPGSLIITGDAYGDNTGNLLTGSISAFYFPNASQGAALSGNEEFQFIFNTTGGDLASYYPSIAVDLEEVDINFNGTFGSSAFDDESGNAQTDNYAAPAPEPSTLALGCLGALVLMARFAILRGTRMLCG
jgi:hypothetical protein